jgi:hemolysin-activating ACP:hemolysin acyltransferase
MFGMKKKQAEPAPAKPAANSATTAKPAAGTASKVAPATGAANGKAPSEADVLKNKEARQRAAIAVRHSLAFAQIVSVIMRSERHRRYPIATLERLVIPPLLTGQFSIAERRSQKNGVSVPVAVALWAKVSAEVDKRLSETLDKPVRLRPSEWRSGETIWLVDAIGDQRVLPAFLKQLSDTTFKGREVKVRSRGKDGKLTVKPLLAAASATAAR